MNPFAAQRRAFELAQAGDYGQATTRFAKALAGFEWLISDAHPRAMIVDRARLIPSYASKAEDITEQFLQALPEWLRDLHFESFYKALINYEIKLARMHWHLLKMAESLPSFASAVNLDQLREQVCQRLKVTRDVIRESVSARASALSRAERILAADGENKTARRLAIYGYTNVIETALEQLTAGKQDESANVLDRLTTGKRQRLQVSLRKMVRRLRQHLRQGRSKAEADIEEMVFSYRQLCDYYIGIGELETAIRLTRRARLLRPEDADLRRWARRVRRLRRRR